MPTKADVLRKAHRRLAIVAADEALSADQEAYGAETYDDMIADLAASHSVTFTWTDTVPAGAVTPLSYLLAVEIAPHYGVAAESRLRALARVRAYALPDDRIDRRDTDGDGAISESEAAAGLRTAYY